jgi:hypothetical protein
MDSQTHTDVIGFQISYLPPIGTSSPDSLSSSPSETVLLAGSTAWFLWGTCGNCLRGSDGRQDRAGPRDAFTNPADVLATPAGSASSAASSSSDALLTRGVVSGTRLPWLAPAPVRLLRLWTLVSASDSGATADLGRFPDS